MARGGLGPLLLLLLAAPAGAAEVEEDPVQRFLSTRESELAPAFGKDFKKRLESSPLLAAALRSGLLDKSLVHDGPPAVLSFATPDGRVILEPAALEPPGPDRLYLLKEGEPDGRELDSEGLAGLPPERLREQLSIRARGPVTVRRDEGLRDALAANPAAAQEKFAGAQAVITGLRGKLKLERPKPDSVRYGSRASDGRTEHLRHERRGDREETVVYAVETEQGTRYLGKPGVERWSRRVNGEEVFLEFSGGEARLTHVWRGGQWVPAAEAGLKDGFLARPMLHRHAAADGEEDALAYSFKRAEDGAIVARAYAQRLRNSASDTWVEVAGAPLARPEGSVMYLHREGQEKLLIRYWKDGRAPEVLRSGKGEFIGSEPVQAAGFAGSAGFEEAGWRWRFDRDGEAFKPALTGQWVGVGAGRGAWADTPSGRPLEGVELSAARRKARAAEIAAMQESLDAERARAEAKRDNGLAWYRSNPAVASRVGSVFERGRPAPLTAEEVRRKASAGEPAASPLGGPAERVASLRGPAAAGEPGRRLLLVTGSEEQSALQQGKLDRYEEIQKAWVGAGENLLDKAQRGMTALALKPEAAVVVLASGAELQRRLDAEVNPAIAQMPAIAAGLGVAQNPGRAAEGARRLDSNLPARRGGGGGLMGRLLNVPGRANAQIYGTASGNLWRATEEMASAREQTLGLAAESLRLERLKALQQAEERLAKKGIGALDLLDAGDARAQAGFAYRLKEGGDYVLRLDLSGELLPKEAFVEKLPGTPAERLTAAVDRRLSTRLTANAGAFITRAEVDGAWDAELSLRFGLTPREAAALRRRLHAR